MVATESRLYLLLFFFLAQAICFYLDVHLQYTHKRFVIDIYNCSGIVVTRDLLLYRQCRLSFTAKDHHFLCVNSGAWGLAKCELAQFC